MKKILLGNAAVARGAYEAGVTVSAAYPGTPSTEITEEISKYDEVYSEWSPNEKVAMEVAIGASFAGARSLVCMKHVGLNVAADPMFTFAYTGVNGGAVIVVADDPGMHSSQNEQDSRFYARSAHLPMIEPADSQEAKDFIKAAYAISEQFDTPVLYRMTTRVAHSRSLVSFEDRVVPELKEFSRKPEKYVMIPARARVRHVAVEQRMKDLAAFAEETSLNSVEYLSDEVGIVCSGCVYQTVKEAYPEASVFKLGLVYPLPLKKLAEFASKVKKVIVIEELEPFFEKQMKANGIDCHGKDVFSVQGEISVSDIRERLFGEQIVKGEADLPARPPVMCAGCPHRGVFHVLRKLKMNVFGDIGCYSLGSAAPLNAVDAVVCMGASVGMALGYEKARGIESAKNTVSVIGDSTFIHSGITGVIDSVYNKGVGTLIILDNSTTGMTGHQNHPATGYTIKGTPTTKLDLEALVKACGVSRVTTVHAYDVAKVEAVVKAETAAEEFSVIIAKRPCVLLGKIKAEPFVITDRCKQCKACLKIGCPSISYQNGVVSIDPNACVGCGVCSQICPFGAIER